MQDLRQLLIDAIPGFEFPRKRLDYVLKGADSPTAVRDKVIVDGGALNFPNDPDNFLDGGDIEEVF